MIERERALFEGAGAKRLANNSTFVVRSSDRWSRLSVSLLPHGGGREGKRREKQLKRDNLSGRHWPHLPDYHVHKGPSSSNVLRSLFRTEYGVFRTLYVLLPFSSSSVSWGRGRV